MRPPTREGLEKEMATHSSILAWRIPWTEEPGELMFMGSHRAGHVTMHSWKAQMGRKGRSPCFKGLS